ncbi:hypothetical protein EJ06DRAFT_526931 [Trichodelitschia bisporula]|uniref:Mitochondrial fission process protein 1 n=1 Tax=Trichodelitschia bisporula TaxID=703511 RepID=A0A6G1I4W4_9PEZI|nr:hypothetical protein EJ06DRAFT_526931 [Trichodelitschia bisporula]
MPADNESDIPHIRKESRPDFSTPPPAKQLPKALQETLDNEEKVWEAMYDGTAGESTDSSVRYAGYASRVRTILHSAHRYVAYTSDIGESFRPVAHPYLVRGAYGVSWAYLAGDVAYEGYKAYLQNQRVLNPPVAQASSNVGVQTTLGPGVAGGSMAGQQKELQPQPGRVVPIEDYRAVMAQRAIFQSLASMGLPAFTIHSAVKYSGRALKDAKNKTLRSYGPIGLGLAIVPFLPYIFDEPVEHAVEWVFHTGFKAVGGPSAVGDRPVTGRDHLLAKESKAGAHKEKEL